MLRRGSFGGSVEELQELLREKGFDISIDSDFGSATELAVMMFQKTNKLSSDGIVGRKTWALLRA